MLLGNNGFAKKGGWRLTDSNIIDRSKVDYIRTFLDMNVGAENTVR